MKVNTSKNKINLLQKNSFINKPNQIILENKKNNNILLKSHIEQIKRIKQKFKKEKANYTEKKIDNSLNSQLLLYKAKKEKIKLSNNLIIYRNKDNSYNKINNNLEYNKINKSHSINNLKNIFPIIESTKNKKEKNNNNNKENHIHMKFKTPTIERNLFNNFIQNTNNSNNNILTLKHIKNTNTKNNNLKNEIYKFIVRPENCGYLVVNCFKHRKNWQEIKKDFDNQNFHFKWQQNIKNIYYNSLSKECGHKQMVNHFEFHNCLTNKANLFYNMMKYAELLDKNVFKYIPFTILFEYNNDNYFKKIEKFQYLYDNIKDYIVSYEEINQIKFKQNKGRLYSSFFPFDNHLGSKTAISILDTHLFIPEEKENEEKNKEGKKDEKKEEKKEEKNNKNKNKKINNLWLIKAPNLNRGMCIKVLNDINIIKKYIAYYNRGIHRGYNDDTNKEAKSKTLSKKYSNILENKDDLFNNVYQSSTIIVQKYIEKPLLYFGRKFDIRIWVLLTCDLKVYVFKEGHLKCCSVKYDLNTNDNYSHLTNYSYQKYNDNFGKYELGNEVSFDDLQNNIDINYNNKINFKKETLPKIYNIINFCFQSVKSKINSMKRKYTFEIFGFDFMIDCNFEPFLIEINTNPGLEESSPLIRMLIPRMIDDALRLTVDKEFDTIYNFDGLEIHSNDNNCNIIYQSPFPVYGYLNSENIFKFICDLTVNEKIKKLFFRKY